MVGYGWLNSLLFQCIVFTKQHIKLKTSVIRAMNVLMMEAVRTSETSVCFYETKRRHIPKVYHLRMLHYFLAVRPNSKLYKKLKCDPRAAGCYRQPISKYRFLIGFLCTIFQSNWNIMLGVRNIKYIKRHESKQNNQHSSLASRKIIFPLTGPGRCRGCTSIIAYLFHIPLFLNQYSCISFLYN
jgi:hypothetical protein